MSAPPAADRILRARRQLARADGRYPESVVRRLAADPAHWFREPDRRFNSKARRSSVVGFEVEGLPIVGKRFHARSRWVAIRRMLGRSPACRAWRNARRVQAAGLRTPATVLCVERRFGPLRGESYLFTEWVDARASDEYLADDRIPARRKALVLGRIIQAMARLHDAGLAHRDLKARNMLIDSDGQVVFIDLDDMRHSWLPALRRRAARADRARLSASLPQIAEVQADGTAGRAQGSGR